jgi:hypothetical protein
MANSVEQTVAELADREAIRELPQRYCDCVWRTDVEGLTSLFAADATFSFISPDREITFTGRAEIFNHYKDSLGAIAPRPYIHNHVVELKSKERASGRCYVELRDGKNSLNWLGTGFYHDEYVKVGDEWKFQSRRFQPAHIDSRVSSTIERQR